MPELKSTVSLTLQGVNSTKGFKASASVTDYCAHAYVQEYQIDSSEDVTIWTANGDPGYADFIRMRIEVLEWSPVAGEFALPVSIESGSSAVSFYMYRPFGVFDFWGFDVWNDASAGGSADTIDAIKILGATGIGGGGMLGTHHVRVTFYTVES